MQNADNMFEYAARHKLRFASARGALSAEQLWDVPLRSKDGFDLDAVAKEANRHLKAMTEESFVATERTPAHEKAEISLELVKRVIAVKIDEEAAAKRRAENRAEKEKLLAILAEKQNGKLSELSERELQRRIAALSV